MELKYTYAESSIKPQPLELCASTVYLRKDFFEQKRTDEQGHSTTYWAYEEAKLTPEEFNAYTSFMISKNAIAGANDSGNILQLVNGQAAGDNKQLIIMNAIVDLYDAIADLTP